MPLSRLEDGVLWAEVLWVDRFGNLQLNVDPEEVARLGDPVGLLLGTSVRDATARSAARVHAYDDLATGELGLVVDSYGLLSIALARASAADELRLGPGDAGRPPSARRQGADVGAGAAAPRRRPSRSAVDGSARPSAPRRPDRPPEELHAARHHHRHRHPAAVHPPRRAAAVRRARLTAARTGGRASSGRCWIAAGLRAIGGGPAVHR